MGWKCPGCGRCYAPHVAMCGSCQPSAQPAITTRPGWPTPPDTSRPLPWRGDTTTVVAGGVPSLPSEVQVARCCKPMGGGHGFTMACGLSKHHAGLCSPVRLNHGTKKTPKEGSDA